MPGGGKRLRHGRGDGLHPLLQLRLCELDRGERSSNLKDLFCESCLEVLADGLLEGLRVLLQHVGDAMQLIHPPCIGLGRVGIEVRFLFVEYWLEPVHGGSSWFLIRDRLRSPSLQCRKLC